MSPRPSFDPGFSTRELTEVFSAESTVAAMLEFEAALALALAEAGIAPADRAGEVAKACRGGVDDPEGVLASTWETGTPLIGLREDVGGAISEEARKWFHFGATSQDAIDTGLMIQAGQALAAVDIRMSSLARQLRDITAEHRDQPQMARTFLQQAGTTTFGFRTATWLDAVIEHIGDLRHHRSTLTVQLGGPVGTLAAYGEKGPQVVSSVAQRLGLAEPNITWHSNRSRVIALAQAMQRVAATMEKIGVDVAVLASSGIAEIRVRSGGSSSMPEKQNPLDAIRTVAAAKACHGAVAMLNVGSDHELDRGVGGWHLEWLALPLAIQTAGAAVEAIDVCIGSLEVDSERMSANAGPDKPDVPPDQVDRVLASYERVLG